MVFSVYVAGLSERWPLVVLKTAAEVTVATTADAGDYQEGLRNYSLVNTDASH